MNWDVLLFALMVVESNGDCSAVGDDGKALGCLQIHACVVEDVNRIYGTSYDWHVDSKYQSSSCKIAKKYATALFEETGCTVRVGELNTINNMEKKS
jgi:hypothetical protein